MFNLYSYEQKKKENEDIDKKKNQYLKIENRRKQLNQKYYQNYKKRVESFLVNMKDDPVIINEYKSFDINYYNFRPDDQPEKFKGHGIFRLTGNHQSVNKPTMSKMGSIINNTQNTEQTEITMKCNGQNSSVRPNSLKNIDKKVGFRQRDIDKEIQPDMRFTSKTTLERIQNFLQQNTQTQVSNTQGNKNMFHRRIQNYNIEARSKSQQVQRRREIQSREFVKNLLPELHIKTHFKATQEQFNLCPTNMNKVTKGQNNIANLVDNKLYQQKQNGEKLYDNEQNNGVYKDILEKCNFQKNIKKMKTKRLNISQKILKQSTRASICQSGKDTTLLNY